MKNNRPELGVIFPTKDIGANPKYLLQIGPAIEEILGIDFILADEHVHEPMVLFGAMAALTRRIRLVTEVLVTPQRPAALIAKQAAEIDILSHGRLTLGIGLGWRGERIEEQIELLRRLWIEKLVQRPIPIWMGGLANKVIERTVRLADGWMPLGYLDDQMKQRVGKFHDLKQKYNRPNLGLMGRINPFKGLYEKSMEEYEGWKKLGATHIAIGSSHDTFDNTDQFQNDLARIVDHLKSRE